MIRGLNDGETRSFYPLAVTLSSYIANMKDSSKGGARQVQNVFKDYLNYIIGEIRLNRKDLSEKTISIYPILVDPLTGEPIKDKEQQEKVRAATVQSRKEDIEIIYEEI